MSREPGFFITFEGGDGAGKTTLIRQVASLLHSEGVSVLVTREPGGTALGEEIRQMVLSSTHTIAPDAELALFLAARAQHVQEKIAPALRQGDTVLCDRFNDSTVAYQGAGRELGLERVQQLCLAFCGGVLPDLTFYLDVNPALGLKRAHRESEGKRDRIESEQLAYHRRVREGFLEIAKREPERICVVDATQSISKVYAEVLAKLKQVRV